MELDPVSVGATARAWDEQHLDLHAAGRQFGGADAGPFTPAVAATAARFAAAWARSTEALGDECETRADGLRTALEEVLAADHRSGTSLEVIRSATREVR